MPNARQIETGARDRDWTKRFVVARMIGDSGLKGQFKTLLLLLEDVNEQVRLAAVQSINKLGLKKGVDPLIQALADPSEWVRVKVVEALGALGTRKDAKLLSQFLENEEDDRVRATIVKVLGEIGGPPVVPVIALYLRDPNDRVRANAVEALEGIGGPGIDGHLAPLVHDKSNRVKANAARALFNLGDGDAVEILKEMILSGDEWMRASAAFVFGEIQSEAAIPYLVRALSDRVWFVVKNVVKSLAKKGDAAVPKLVECLRGQTKTTVVNALAALAEIGSSDCLTDLIPLLHHEDGDIRERAEEVVDRIRERARKA